MQEDTKTITLRTPVSLGSTSYDKLELREPTAAQIVKAQKEMAANGPMASNILLIAEVTGIPKAAVERMGIRDVQEASRFLAGFIEEPATGSDSSPS